MTTEFVRTDDVATHATMRACYPARCTDNVIKVHVGEWRRDGDMWRLHRDPTIKHKNGPVIKGDDDE